MKSIAQLVRPNILSLKPYSSARDEFKGSEGIFLDANENPFGELNRYPDPLQKDLKAALADFRNISSENIFIGNGSDEVIDLAFRIFCRPGIDRVITCPPTYGMYEVSAGINDAEVIRIPLKEDFQLDIDNILKTDAKIIFICSPNNPTGNCLENIEMVLANFKGIVFVDEAYIDFSMRDSFVKRISEYPNLIVAQTFSKAWALAAARIGIAYAGTEIISMFNKVKSPYNVSDLNKKAALQALRNIAVTKENVSTILLQKRMITEELSKFSFVKKIYPSDANFLLVEVADADKLYSHLIAKKIVTRNRSSVVNNCIRITVGTPAENSTLINELKAASK